MRTQLNTTNQQLLQQLANGGLENLYSETYDERMKQLYVLSYQFGFSSSYDALREHFKQEFKLLAFELFATYHLAHGGVLSIKARDYFNTLVGEKQGSIAPTSAQLSERLSAYKSQLPKRNLGKFKQLHQYDLVRYEQKIFWRFVWEVLLFIGVGWVLYKFVELYRETKQGRRLYRSLLQKSQETFLLEGEVLSEVESKEKNYALIEQNLQMLYYKERRLDAENREQQRLLTEIASDIRVPLNAIKLYGALLSTTNLHSRQREYVESIQQNGQLLNKVVDTTLLGIRENIDDMKMALVNFDLHQQVELVAESFKVSFEHKQNPFSLFIDPMLQHSVQGDMAKLTTILHIVLSYALEYSRDGGAIALSVEGTNGLLDKVTFCVAYEILETLEDHKEMESLLESVEGGEPVDPLAFDLFLVKQIVALLGGELVYELSEKQVSFTFTLFLPQMEHNEVRYPQFEDLTIGIALPSEEMKSSASHNLERYLDHLGVTYSYYYYEALFGKDDSPSLPDIMVCYTQYAQQEEEIERFMHLGCRIAVITSPLLKGVLFDEHRVSSIGEAPMTMHKVIQLIKGSLCAVEEEHAEVCTLMPQFKNIRALVVEDNPTTQKLLFELLENLGLEVTIAGNGKMAFDLRRNSNFDIIFMDIDMPIMDGVESTKKILYYEHINQLEHIPLVAVTSYANGDQNDYFIELGMDAFIAKPIYAKEIKEVIQKYCIEMPQKELAQSDEW
jgi:CheY-like chemotaxis protein/signal transduction histidine kinase